MSDFRYNVLALIPVTSNFSVANAVTTFKAAGYVAALIAPPRGDGMGFRVVYFDDWGVNAWFEDATNVADENDQIIDVFGVPPEPGDNALKCDRRLSVWSDDDSDMMNAHLFEEYIGVLKDQLGLFVFDEVLGIWR